MSRINLVHLCSKIENINIVAVCESGIQAINELEKNSIDLLFLDIEMPDLTGMELVKSLNNLPQVIFTTNRREYALEAFEHDVTDYLTKPITLPRLLKAVDKAIISVDKDRTVCESIRTIFEHYGQDYDLGFANGGDQDNNSIPEAPICKELGIQLIDGLGDKIQSSSWLLNK